MDSKYLILLNSLTNLSKPYQEQLNKFPDYVDVVDEIISDFEDAFHFVPKLMEQYLLQYDAVKYMIICKNLIALNLSIEERKTDESFGSDECWQLVRTSASNALKTMNSIG